MPTYDEIASQYAEIIKSAIRKSRIIKSASLVTESKEREELLNNLKEIFNDVNIYVKEDKTKLTDSDKDYIFNLVGKKLGLSNPEKVYLIIKEASNDRFIELLTYWNQFYKEILKWQLK